MEVEAGSHLAPYIIPRHCIACALGRNCAVKVTFR